MILARDWRELVELYYNCMGNWEISQAQLSAIALVYRAAQLVSLEGHFLEGYALYGFGKLGELVYTTAVGTPYALYRAAWDYPFQFAEYFGLDFRQDWPVFESAPPLYLWLQDLPKRDWGFFCDAIEQIVEDEDTIPSVLLSVEERLPMALGEVLQSLEQVIDTLSDRVQEEVTEVINRLDRVQRALDPMSSQFVDFTNPSSPFIPIKRPPGSGILTVIPDPAQADAATNLQELDIYPNVFDLIAVSVHLLAAYLGADRLPRPWLPVLGQQGQNPQWQLNNLADLIGQLHAEFRESVLVDTEVRVDAQGDQTERVRTNLGTALGLVLAALRDLSLDSERTLALSAQAAQASLTAVAGLGTKTVNQPVDLGFRGQVPSPVATGASLAQQIQALEILCSSIALQLGVSLKPAGQR